MLEKLPWCHCWHQFILYFLKSFDWDFNSKGRKKANNILKVTVSAYLPFSQRGSNKISELYFFTGGVAEWPFLLLTLQSAFGTSQDHISSPLGTVQCKKREIKMLREKHPNWLVEKDCIFQKTPLIFFCCWLGGDWSSYLSGIVIIIHFYNILISSYAEHNLGANFSSSILLYR